MSERASIFRAIYVRTYYIQVNRKATNKTQAISAWKRCSIRLYFQLFVEGLISFLLYLCLFAHSGVQHILRCVFRCLVYPMLPVSLDCPFLIASLVLSNGYLCNTWVIDWRLLNVQPQIFHRYLGREQARLYLKPTPYGDALRSSLGELW